ncbi:serine hydrolase domain-containing protein [Tessaracoccus caeni]|uniref:serine hydrolase domain-containing protein n=1 Tax=Tessaracoccus caeni TaxID=3031239 RepID=UPI0023DBDFEA|nr:serine hydrolase domain-containing protein [Tessaracoccus caeni]MDF1490385.1 serine hydrolase [Tessaracoccus caeni]
MRRFAALVVGASFFLGVCAGESPGPDVTRRTSGADGVSQSEALLEHLLTTDAPGCSAAVAVDGTLAWAGARGVADMETKEPLTEAGLFDFASVAKQFTATAILLLEKEGTLSLEDSLRDWLPELPSWAASITLAEMMRHRTGIPDYTWLLVDAGVDVSDLATQDDALRAIGEVEELADVPGLRFDYSNSNYVLLAEVVEAATGRPFADFLARRVFGEHELRLEPASDAIVTGYEGGRPSSPAWLQTGDGSVVGTPTSLVLWADYYRTGLIDGVDLAGRATADAVPMGGPDGISYGAGIVVDEAGALSHSGAWAGQQTLFGVTPDRRTVIAVSCNSMEIPVDDIAQGLRKIWEEV